MLKLVELAPPARFVRGQSLLLSVHHLHLAARLAPPVPDEVVVERGGTALVAPVRFVIGEYYDASFSPHVTP